MKKMLISIINFYQKVPLPTHKQCRFTPTCSEYAKEAITEYGAFTGTIMSIKRILRCNPFNKHYGYDPVVKKEK